MPQASLVAVAILLPLGPALGSGRSSEPGEALQAALRKAAAVRAYAFRVDSPGGGAGGPVAGKYEQGQPVSLKADGVAFYKKGDTLVYEQGGTWQRTKRGTESDPLRILGASARVVGVRLPHAELAEMARGLTGAPGVEKGKDQSTVYTAALTEAGARALAPTEVRSVTRGGRVTVRVGAGGDVVGYEVTIRVQGRLGNAEIDGARARAVTLTEVGKARVVVPTGARKALE